MNGFETQIKILASNPLEYSPVIIFGNTQKDKESIRRRLTDLELGSDYLYFTSDFDYYIISPETSMTDDDFEILHLFENLCLSIPHP